MSLPAAAQMRSQTGVGSVGPARAVLSPVTLSGGLNAPLAARSGAAVLLAPTLPAAAIAGQERLSAVAAPHASEAPVPAADMSPAAAGASAKKQDSGRILDALLARPAAEVSFDGARAGSGDVSVADAPSLETRGGRMFSPGLRASMDKGIPGGSLSFKRRPSVAGMLALGMPATSVAAWAGLGAAAALLAGAIGATSGVLAAISVLFFLAAVGHGARSVESFQRTMLAGGVLGFVSAVVGAAHSAAAFDGVMTSIFAVLYVSMLSALIIALIRRVFGPKPPPEPPEP